MFFFIFGCWLVPKNLAFARKNGFARVWGAAVYGWYSDNSVLLDPSIYSGPT